jgi:hypothetical protein
MTELYHSRAERKSVPFFRRKAFSSKRIKGSLCPRAGVAGALLDPGSGVPVSDIGVVSLVMDGAAARRKSKSLPRAEEEEC